MCYVEQKDENVNKSGRKVDSWGTQKNVRLTLNAIKYSAEEKWS